MANKKQKLGAAIPLTLPPEMEKELDALSKKTGQTKANLMRLSIQRGIGAVERMFELPAAEAA